MRFLLYYFFLFTFLALCPCSFAQEDEIEIDSVALQKRIDSEFNALKEWRDSIARAKGLALPNEEQETRAYPEPGIATTDQLQESQEKLSQFKKIVIGLFVLVMVVGVFLSKPWKKRNEKVG
jgi:hypothetical protein